MVRFNWDRLDNLDLIMREQAFQKAAKPITEKANSFAIAVTPSINGLRWQFNLNSSTGNSIPFPLLLDFQNTKTAMVTLTLNTEGIQLPPNYTIQFCEHSPIIVDSFNDDCSFDVMFGDSSMQSIQANLHLLHNVALWRPGVFSFQICCAIYNNSSPKRTLVTKCYSQDPKISIGGTTD